MPDRYMTALIKSETVNDRPQDDNDVARRERWSHSEQRNQSQRPDAGAGQLSFAFVR
jgi:hypothetical protein